VLARIPLAGRLRPATTACGALAYARISKSIQTTIPGQLERIEALSRQLGVPVVRVLTDTGSGMTSERDGYQVLFDEVDTEQYSHVLLFKADRLARDSAELQTTVKKLWRLGIKVYDTSVGELTPQVLPVLAMLAEMEIRQLSERTDMGLEQHAQEGSKLGQIPLGYLAGEQRGRHVPDPALEPHLKELFRRAARGESLRSLQTWFNGVTGRKLEPSSVRRLLQNPYYMGLIVNFRRRESIIHGTYARPQEDWKHRRHEHPLVDEETWLQVQAQLAKHRNVGQHRRRPSAHALAGLLWCGRCARRMYGHGTARQGVTYACRVCHLERGRRKVEQAALRCLARIELNSAEARAIQAEQARARRAEAAAELQRAGQEVRRLTAQRARLYERLDAGIIDTEQYQAQVSALDAERVSWQERESALKRTLGALPNAGGLEAELSEQGIDWQNWTHELAQRPVEHQQRIYRECCTRLTIDPLANTLEVEYTPHIALCVGTQSWKVALGDAAGS
jgi:DNA invertase Pin-like site-specific DNA recombinase